MPRDARAHVAPAVRPAPAINAVEVLVQIHKHFHLINQATYEQLEPQSLEVVAHGEEAAATSDARSLRPVPTLRRIISLRVK